MKQALELFSKKSTYLYLFLLLLAASILFLFRNVAPLPQAGIDLDTASADIAEEKTTPGENHIYVLKGDTATRIGTVGEYEIGSLLLTGATAQEFDYIARGTDDFYMLRANREGPDALVRIGMDGSETVVSSLPMKIGSHLDYTALSPDRTRIAYCNQDANPEVLQMNTGTRTVYPAKGSCSKEALRLWFSIKGDQLLFQKSFWELYGDYTPEEVRAMQEKEGHGYYSIDLGTGSVTYLGLDLVDISSAVAGRYAEAVYSETPYEGTVQVWNVAGKADFVPAAQLQALPILATIAIPGAMIENPTLTADGQGVLYTSHRYSESFGWSDTKLGFYDIGEQKNYYPLTSSHETIIPVSSPSRDALYYKTEFPLEGQSLVDKDQGLVRVNLSGEKTIVDRKPLSVGGAYGYVIYTLR